jgi:hypothetical protein
MHADARRANPPGGTSENLELAPVLAISKLLGMMENNEAPYQINKPQFQNNNSYYYY